MGSIAGKATSVPDPSLRVHETSLLVPSLHTLCQNESVAVGRAQRRIEREPRVAAIFSEAHAPRALDLLELTELAWHDSYGDITPSEDVIDDMLVVSGGSLDKLIQAARLAVTDWRDLKVAADAVRNRS